MVITIISGPSGPFLAAPSCGRVSYKLYELLALILCSSSAVACSIQSRNTEQPPLAQAPAAATTTASATNAPTGGTVDAALVKEGYRVVKHHDKILYCQTQSVTGTKFDNTVCMTAEQIHELKRETEQSKRLLNRSGPTSCSGNTCSPGSQ